MSKSNETTATQEDRITALENRLTDVEGQLLVCMRFMRHEAEKQAKEKNPDFMVHDLAKA